MNSLYIKIDPYCEQESRFIMQPIKNYYKFKIFIPLNIIRWFKKIIIHVYFNKIYKISLTYIKAFISSEWFLIILLQ